jgi:hypothetical protein
LDCQKNSKSGGDVWFSFIIFESKEHRDEVNKKVMKEMDEAYQEQSDFTSPFEMSRMAYGGLSGGVDTYEQVALLKAQKVRLDEEEGHILLRREYVSLKIEYWKAYERGDKKRVQEIAAQAKSPADDLKKV